jgi:HSP20 family protein
MLQLLNDLTRHWQPWSELERFSRNPERLLPDTLSAVFTGNRAPANVYLSENGAKVVVQLPGWEAPWFDLSTEGNRLILKGEVPEEERKERGFHTFERQVTLPFRMASDTIKATYRDGLLFIEVEKHEQEKPKKISVVSA